MVTIKQLSECSLEELDKLFNRYGDDFSDIMIQTVVPIVQDVQKRGDEAVKEYTRKFDGVDLDSILATEEDFQEARETAPEDVLDAFMKAAENVREFHTHQKRDKSQYTRDDGFTLGVVHQAIESAAIYVPGGKASYPSSVLMGIIPAQIAGVKDITVITPPGKDGKVPAIVLALCEKLDVKRVLKSGGAQGIAAAGLGTETVPKASIIVGPGNIYVTAAKTYLFSLGLIQIDSLAGPSEVLIIADEKAPSKWVAWDFLSQAEHEEMALAVLVTTSEKLAKEVAGHIEEDLNSGRGRSEIKKISTKNGGLILLVDSLDEAIDFSNKYGPEHMEFMVENSLDYVDRIKNVGSLFLGYHAPVAVGDYYSGTNHILPTGGAARFSSGTSVDTFMRRTTYQLPTEKALKSSLDPITRMSKYEGFDDKHGGSVAVRFEKE